MTDLGDGVGELAAADETHSSVAQLVAADKAYERRAELKERLVHATEICAITKSELESATAAYDAESDDVDDLEKITPTRIWSSLNGSRAERLEREESERSVAEAAFRTAQDAYATANAKAGRLRRSIIDLGDVDEARAAAGDAVQDWMLSSDVPGADELAPLVQEIGSVRVELDEMHEAMSAVETAADRLTEAASWLAKAGDWSTYDAFFNGGMISDAMKYDRIDKAKASIATAEESLRTLSSELSDIGMTSIGGVEISGLTSTFDVWFDNIFSDLAVRDSIREGAGRVESARQAVARVGTDLTHRDGQLSQRMSTLASARDALLRNATVGRM